MKFMDITMIIDVIRVTRHAPSSMPSKKLKTVSDLRLSRHVGGLIQAFKGSLTVIFFQVMYSSAMDYLKIAVYRALTWIQCDEAVKLLIMSPRLLL